jgi:hypothetical protein
LDRFVREQLALFSINLSLHMLFTVDQKSDYINSAKHNGEYFADEKQFRELHAAIADFWEELAGAEKIRPLSLSVMQLRQQHCLEVGARPAMLALVDEKRRTCRLTVGNVARLGASQRPTTRRCASHYIATQRASRQVILAALECLARTVALQAPEYMRAECVLLTHLRHQANLLSSEVSSISFA